MLIVDVDPLEAIDLLDFVDEVPLQFLIAKDIQDIVGIDGPIHEGFSSFDLISLEHIDMLAPRDQIFLFLTILRHDLDLSHSLRHASKLYSSVDLRDDRRLPGPPSFKELCNPWQTPGNVLGLCRLPRDLDNRITGGDRLTILHREVGTHRQQRPKDGDASFVLHRSPGLELFFAVLHNDPLSQPGDLIHLLLHGHPLTHIFDHHVARCLRENHRGEGIPLR